MTSKVDQSKEIDDFRFCLKKLLDLSEGFNPNQDDPTQCLSSADEKSLHETFDMFVGVLEKRSQYIHSLSIIDIMELDTVKKATESDQSGMNFMNRSELESKEAETKEEKEDNKKKARTKNIAKCLQFYLDTEENNVFFLFSSRLFSLEYFANFYLFKHIIPSFIDPLSCTSNSDVNLEEHVIINQCLQFLYRLIRENEQISTKGIKGTNDAKWYRQLFQMCLQHYLVPLSLLRRALLPTANTNNAKNTNNTNNANNANNTNEQQQQQQQLHSSLTLIDNIFQVCFFNQNYVIAKYESILSSTNWFIQWSSLAFPVLGFDTLEHGIAIPQKRRRIDSTLKMIGDKSMDDMVTLTKSKKFIDFTKDLFSSVEVYLEQYYSIDTFDTFDAILETSCHLYRLFLTQWREDIRSIS
ncbi:hypothetical protein RFI_19091, partial [Reticulomyxa filosa]